ncbi:PREDICTED: ribonuclease H2 subunit C-like [Priapulus caudatus]|uniref:Ribonuclease H2 subunit C-like n=1 Tax=Priapulus caudatus TaxID=37621 RepID=A0ABM1EGK5_PRICU|nr:PREDICTED: ribonuclease H2 subunit C-like [Priapulus caudatus]
MDGEIARISIGNVKQEQPAVTHLMPCKIDHDGKCNVAAYFTHTINHNEASFRGRPLRGQDVRLPNGYTGICLREATPVYAEGSEDKVHRRFHITGEFSQFTYWNLDKETTDDDAVIKALNWVELASVIHAPLDCSLKDGCSQPNTTKKSSCV